jgi:Flp pilus assembly protein TadG
MGCLMSEKTTVLPRRTRRFLKRLRRNEDGAAAVEFALVAMPFFGLIIAIVELGIFFFASRYFEDGMFNASRQVMTQRLPAATICTAFKNEIAANFPRWLDPNKIVLTVKANNNFGSAGASTIDLGSGGCSFGAPNQVVTITGTYPYPFQGFRFIAGGTLWGANLQLAVSTAFRVEPPL